MQSDFGWRIVGGIGAALVVWGGMLTPYVVAACYPREWYCYVLWLCTCTAP